MMITAHGRLRLIATVLSLPVFLYSLPIFLKIPFRVFHIVLPETLCLILLGVLDKLGRNATPQFMGTYLGVLQHQGTGSYNSPLAYLTVVEQSGSHAYQRTIMDGTGMHRGIVTDGNIIANDGGTSGVGDVDARAILHIGATSPLTTALNQMEHSSPMVTSPTIVAFSLK